MAIVDQASHNELPARIAFVVDKKGWAFDNIARHAQPLINRGYDVAADILYTQDFANEAELLELLIERQYNSIHFFWRMYFKAFVEYNLAVGRAQDLERALTASSISFSIPDHLFSDPSGVFDYSPYFHLADGYCTTSRRLFDLYADQILVPRPCCIIHDRTDLIVDLTCRQRQPSTDTERVHVLWTGNSEWGRWNGLRDYKGVEIIRAAISAARDAGAAIEYVEIDSSREHVSQERVAQSMLSADVYVCASENEGTPLPVVEAMAAGCGVVTTDVGIFREIAPETQHPLIVERRVGAFRDALLTLTDNRARIAEIGSLNREAIRGRCDLPIQEQWMHFLARVYSTSRTAEQIEAKKVILRHMQPSGLGVKLNTLRNLVRRSPVALAVAKKIYPMAAGALRSDDTQIKKARVLRLQRLRRVLLSRNDLSVKTLAIYNPMWRGVAASTRALIDKSLPIPLSDDQHASSVTSQEIHEYVAILRALNPKRLVISGGEQLHWKIASQFKAANPDTRVELITHSSQMHWTDDHHRNEFMMWIPSYHTGMLDKIWVLKQGLDIILRNNGIESEAIENYLPQIVSTPRTLRTTGPYNIGLWSVDNNWQKNLTSQLLAFAGDRRFLVHYTATDPALNSLVSAFAVPHVRVHEGPLPHGHLLSWMSKMDLNLYVTLSECSPMTPLESISLGVPCIVGPTTTFFNDNPLLRSSLVVPSPEDVGSIRATVDAALANYDVIAEEIIRLGYQRERYLREVKSRLNSDVNSMSGVADRAVVSLKPASAA